MRVLSLGLDNAILKPDSPVAMRAGWYGGLVEKYTVIVPAAADQSVALSERVAAIGIAARPKSLGLWRIYRKAALLCRTDNYDVITVQDQYYLAIIGWRLARRFRRGFELQVHGFERYQGWLRPLVFKFAVKRADAVRTVSQKLKNRLVKEFGVDEKKITVVPVYVENTNVNEYRTNVNESEKQDRFIFLTVGRLVKIKNIGMQLRALKRVLEEYPQTEIWIVGQGPLKAVLRSLAHELGIENNIKFFGWVEPAQTKEMYFEANALLLTSHAEGWPQVVVEAAVRSCPIIMTDVGSAGELIINEKTGLVVPVGDEEALAGAMKRLISDGELRKRLAMAAREAAMKLPSLEQTLKLYLESWEKAVAR